MTAAIPPSMPQGPADASKDAAERLSAYFVRRFLTEAKVGESLIGGAGGASGQFADMLRDALANAMSEGDGLGLGEAFADQLGGEQDFGATLTAIVAHRSIGVAEPRLSTAPLAGGSVSSRFGLRADPFEGDHRHHSGLDIAAPKGTPVVSAGPGTVVRAEMAGNYGNLVVVDHGDGLETRYAHLDAIDVQPGDQVAPGAALGSVGETGRATGPHLHFEVRRDGHAENPLRVVSGLNAAGSRSR